MQTNTLKKTNIDDIINNFWFANIPIENKVSEVKHTCESLDGLFPHLEIKNITSNQDYKNIITTEILRLIGQLDNVSSCESLNNYGLSLNNKNNKTYTLICESDDKKKTSLVKSFKNGSIKHINEMIETQDKAYKTQVKIETPIINQFWCSLKLNSEIINIHIGSNGKGHNYEISCTNIPAENMKIIEYFFHTFTKVLTLPEVEDCCLLVNDIIKKECDNDINRINNIDTITKVLKEIQAQMLSKHPNIRKYLEKCSIQIPDFLKKSLNLQDDNVNDDKRSICNICNICSSCLSSTYDEKNQKDI